MDKEEISVDKYELLSDEDKEKYYQDYLLNFEGKKLKNVTRFYQLKSLRGMDRDPSWESIKDILSKENKE